MQRRSHTKHSLRVSAVDLQLAVRTTDATLFCFVPLTSLAHIFKRKDRLANLRDTDCAISAVGHFALLGFFVIKVIFFLFSANESWRLGLWLCVCL